MLLLRLLDHDLHASRKSVEAVPLWIETPARPNFVPAVVSLSTPKFGVTRKLKDGKIRSGIFRYDSDRLDEVIPNLLREARSLSEADGYPNRFDDPRLAFSYIQKESGLKTQPHSVIVPDSWDESQLIQWGRGDVRQSPGGKGGKSATYTFRESCSVLRSPVDSPVFFSRPDFVGMYTQFMGGRTSIILHNVKSGLAFCAGVPDVHR